MLGDLLSNRFTEFAEFTLCDGVTNSTTVVHNFNKRGVHVEVYRSVTPWDTVECDIERPSLNEVTIRFASIPTAGAYQAVVIG